MMVIWRFLSSRLPPFRPRSFDIVAVRLIDVSLAERVVSRLGPSRRCVTLQPTLSGMVGRLVSPSLSFDPFSCGIKLFVWSAVSMSRWTPGLRVAGSMTSHPLTSATDKHILFVFGFADNVFTSSALSCVASSLSSRFADDDVPRPRRRRLILFCDVIFSEPD